jgi:signal transduction histidine kinase
MRIAALPVNETERLAALHTYRIVDAAPITELDNITTIATALCHMPMGMITLVDKDKQWFGAARGINGTAIPRDHSFCAHAILQPQDIFTVPDATADVRFANNPQVVGPPYIKFYAGVPLVNHDGLALGALCVVDTHQRSLSQEQASSLRVLAKQAMQVMELHKKNQELQERQKELNRMNKELEQFAYLLAHDIKSPCSNIAALSYLIAEQITDRSPDVDQMLGLLTDTAKQIAGMVDGILDHARAVNMTEPKKERFYFVDLVQDLNKLLTNTDDCMISVVNPNTELWACRADITRILLNLCTNAIKYNDKADKAITLTVTNRAADYLIAVTDNGTGILPEYFNRIFDLFGTVAPKGTDTTSFGIGLYTVKRLVDRLGGKITVSSQVNQGSTFSFTVAK